MPLPLDGLRMVDVTENLAGPYCSMLLSDMGVETIKIERPGSGDSTRGWGEPRETVSRAFTMVNRNKRSLVVNLKDERGRAIVRWLALQADILLENHRPGYMDAIGLGYEALREQNPRLIYAQISGFGQTGPYRERGGLDLIAQAMSGLMSVTGEEHGAPNKAGFPVTDLGTGMFAAYGVLCALQARERTGQGQRVDCSLFETGVAWSVWQAAKYLDTGEPPGRMGSAHPLSAPYQAFPTADGQIVIGAGGQPLYRRLCAVLGVAELIADPRFDTQPKRMQRYQELAALLSERTRLQSSEQLLCALAEAGIPAGPINDVGQMLDDPQAQARQMVIETDHPVFGPLRTIGNPVKLSETPWALRRLAPKLGEHSDAILHEAGYTDAEIAALREAGVV
ncbi:MAG TPA: CoA transferase [Dehalococcoidia bacterium]|nr:CoA transferase [Dehalococcoidia bacterium]